MQAKTLNKFDTVVVVVNDGSRDLRQGIMKEVLGDGSNGIVTIVVGNHEIKPSGGTKIFLVSAREPSSLDSGSKFNHKSINARTMPALAPKATIVDGIDTVTVANVVNIFESVSKLESSSQALNAETDDMEPTTPPSENVSAYDRKRRVKWNKTE